MPARNNKSSYTFFRLISVSDSLPVSTSVKMIEIWMLFCLMLTFVDVLLQTYIHYMREQRTMEEENEAEEMREVLRKFLFPLSQFVVSSKR
jgi:hypothetical protein